MSSSISSTSRIFKNRPFDRFMRKERIADSTILEAAFRAERGLIDADLGGGVIKQRIAREGKGKSGGYRVILLFQVRDSMFFVYGFGKKDLDNIDKHELTTYKKLAKLLSSLSEEVFEGYVDAGVYIEVKR